jgi:glycosyltransferase involved in cell wall biosynthesis
MSKQLQKDSTLVSLVVPMYNEEGNLAAFFDRASKVLSELGLPWEMIFVNDGSSDDSIG